MEHMRINGIRNVDDKLTLSQTASASQVCYPLTTAHERHLYVAQHLAFLFEHLCCPVRSPSAFRQLGALVTASFIASTVSGIMADTSEIPHIMHRNHYWLTSMQNPVQVGHRQETLIYPMQMDDVSLFELKQMHDISTRIR